LPDHHRQDRTLPKTLRAELLTGRRFPSLALAQQAVDAWVVDYNHRRPHQAIAMLVPAQRFRLTATATQIPVPAFQPRQPLTVGPTEITRRVSASGLIGVCYQQVSAGRHLAGQIVTSGCTPPCSRCSSPASSSARSPAAAPRRWSSSEPTGPTGPNDNPQPTREVSTITRTQTGKHQPELDNHSHAANPKAVRSEARHSRAAADL
jgi:hypothetical protein